MKAISPVIATVIIVAVAITIAIAVAFWMTGISTSFTRYEKITFVSAYAVKTDNGWNIGLYLENIGATDATIDEIFINGKPFNVYPNVYAYYKEGREIVKEDTDFSTWTPFTSGVGTTLSTGESITIAIVVPSDLFKSGITIEIKVHTASGGEYPRMITLP